ncbi:gibberellin 2-beta-dioxygenase-like [Primulina tabacum]|uniref:gibberellin 2-beta-dioxygenase-like n=1 Tax=Primulina tabacum TaxID=48773 RepID=UPI003F5A532D
MASISTAQHVILAFGISQHIRPTAQFSAHITAMVVLSQQVDILDNFSQVKKSYESTFTGIPVVDLSDPDAKTLIVKASKEIGFFKVVNHGVSMELISKLEDEAVRFFGLPLEEKQKSAGTANPFGYGNKRIGCHGDVGWVEYLLFCTNHELILQDAGAALPAISESLRCLVMEYVSSVRNLGCEVLQMMADGLQIKPRNIMSKLIKDERSDSCFRVNHYPPSPELEAFGGGRNLIGFGEHTDPQIISIARSNHIEGLQICLQDTITWVSVPPDPSAVFIDVGDSLQVMTNGRFRSVKHRVLAGGLGSRVSMIFFGGPPLSQIITPLASLMQEDEESSYKEFTWCEYKTSAYNTRLADNRLSHFQKS